jgi:hypothetical protein
LVGFEGSERRKVVGVEPAKVTVVSDACPDTDTIGLIEDLLCSKLPPRVTAKLGPVVEM